MSFDPPPTSVSDNLIEKDFFTQGYRPSQIGFKETIPDSRNVKIYGRKDNDLMKVFTTQKIDEVARQTIDQTRKEKQQLSPLPLNITLLSGSASQSIVWSPKGYRQNALEPFPSTTRKESKLRVLKTITLPPRKAIVSGYDPGKIFGYDAPGGLGANLIA